MVQSDRFNISYAGGEANVAVELACLGVDVCRELVLEESKTSHSWKNPVWRHADGSVAEW